MKLFDVTCDMICSCCSLLYLTCPCCLKKLGPTLSLMKASYIICLRCSGFTATHNFWKYNHVSYKCMHLSGFFDKCWMSRIYNPSGYFWLRSSRSWGQPRCVFQLSIYKITSYNIFIHAPTTSTFMLKDMYFFVG